MRWRSVICDCSCSEGHSFDDLSRTEVIEPNSTAIGFAVAAYYVHTLICGMIVPSFPEGNPDAADGALDVNHASALASRSRPVPVRAALGWFRFRGAPGLWRL